MVKITSDTLKRVNKLPQGQREKVDGIVRAHVRACQNNGFEPENLERVYIEAMEQVKIEERFPETEPEAIGNRWEPVRRYEQYRSPKAV